MDPLLASSSSSKLSGTIGVAEGLPGDDIQLIASPVTLPNGTVVPNRLVKAAMEEGIGNGGGVPDKRHRTLYKRWAEGGWGMIITGNVQVDPRHLATPHDRTFPDHSPSTIASYALLRSSILSSAPPTSPRPVVLMQISHPGLQSSSTICFSRPPWEAAIGPSAARPDTGHSALGWLLGRILWPTKSRPITDFDEWLDIVDLFVKGAQTAESAGWDGVQIHSAHGYLLAEYLSPLTNPDPRPLPGVPWDIPLRLHLLWLILTGIAKTTDKTFIKAVKINSSDFVQGGLDEAQSSSIIKTLVSWNLIDMLEISGGNYSSPVFATFDGFTSDPTSTSSPTRQSLFAHFTRTLLPDLPAPPCGPAIMLTGGLHSRHLIADAIRTRSCDLAGIGRPACVIPDLPDRVVLNREIPAEEAVLGGYNIPGGETMKYLLGGGRIRARLQVRSRQYAPSSWTSYSELPRRRGHIHRPLTPAAAGAIRIRMRIHPPPPAHNAEYEPRYPLVGAGISTFWHEWQCSRLGRGVEPDMRMHWFWGGLLREAVWWGMLGGGPRGWWASWRG
ncbi:hypothetical protein EHS25_008037 [Saitozyma podzolica]|uniref:NADH:flavin oxidoreductase/NADH oxidase N-terminal domain-containing protein n=1 Tax=Saitozyma podzolica TaxID=1890683 RepID=A0A427YN88_9TREE|nr:hypothetical protein EHS25_008037 [Saitozyma podzolica]